MSSLAGVHVRADEWGRPGRRAWAVASALSRVEGLRLLRKPLLFLGTLLSAYLLYLDLIGDEPGSGWAYFSLLGFGLLPLAAAVLVAATLGAGRSRRHATEELEASLPASAQTRTMAHLLAVAWPVGLAAVLLGVAVVAYVGSGIPPVDLHGTRHTPTPIDLAQGLAMVAAAGVVGVALAGWLPTVAGLVAAPLAVVTVLVAEIPLAAWGLQLWWRWFAPFVNPSITGPGEGWPCGGPDSVSWCRVHGFAERALAWHDLYLMGIAVMAGALALLRHGRGSILLASVGAGLALTVAGGLLQLLPS